MNSIDKWLDKRYRRSVYTCSDFCREVWADLTGVDIAPALIGLLQAHDGRGLRREHVRHFKALAEPLDPCLVVMQRPKSPVHLAIYIRGKVLQITERGVEFSEIHVATQFHKSYRFITCTP